MYHLQFLFIKYTDNFLILQVNVSADGRGRCDGTKYLDMLKQATKVMFRSTYSKKELATVVKMEYAIE